MKFKILVIDKTKFSWENYGDQQHPSINVMEFCQYLGGNLKKESTISKGFCLIICGQGHFIIIIVEWHGIKVVRKKCWDWVSKPIGSY